MVLAFKGQIVGGKGVVLAESPDGNNREGMAR